jgi:hypothetical protein
MPTGRCARAILPLLIVGGTTAIISGGVAILYSVQRSLVYTPNYPEGSRKHVKSQFLNFLLNFLLSIY